MTIVIHTIWLHLLPIMVGDISFVHSILARGVALSVEGKVFQLYHCHIDIPRRIYMCSMSTSSIIPKAGRLGSNDDLMLSWGLYLWRETRNPILGSSWWVSHTAVSAWPHSSLPGTFCQTMVPRCWVVAVITLNNRPSASRHSKIILGMGFAPSCQRRTSIFEYLETIRSPKTTMP